MFNGLENSRLTWFDNKQPKIIFQSEASECGLACLAMIASFHGNEINLLTLRRKHSMSLKGSTLANLINISKSIGFFSRPLRLDLDELDQLKTPCILHWNLNHFVVLQKVTKKTVIILDPALGKRTLSLDDCSRHFSGVALELHKNKEFKKEKSLEKLKIYDMFKGIKGFKTNIIILLLIALVLQIIGLLSPFLMQWILDKVIPSNDLNLLSLILIGFTIVLITNIIISFINDWIALYFGSNLSLQLNSSVFIKLINLPLPFFQNRHLGDIVSKFGSMGNIQNIFTGQFITVTLNSIFGILTFVLMILYSFKLSLVVLGTFFIYAIVRWISYLPLHNLSQEGVIVSAQTSSYFLETIRGIKAIQFFNKQEARTIKWFNSYVKEVNVGLKASKLTMILSSINSILFGVENIIIIWIGVHNVLSGAFTVGVFIAFMSYKEQFKSKINGLINSFIDYKLLDIDRERLADIVLVSEEQEVKNFFDMSAIKDTCIDIRNLSFTYNNESQYIINDLSLHIADNEFVAITGVSGKGKTTLMNLIAGINRPTSGDIAIGGKSIVGLSLPNSLISMVSQDDTLYAGSILENICFFDYGADLDWVDQCAKMAQIYDDITNMPMGYETLVGDMGTTLSGGQKQRLFIARALYFKPKILLLDEATSHLDSENERKINEVLKKLSITRIIIAHRIETINTADRVINL